MLGLLCDVELRTCLLSRDGLAHVKLCKGICTIYCSLIRHKEAFKFESIQL